MKNILVDSSVWIEYFAGNNKVEILSRLIDKNLICVNELILCELVPFLKHNRQDKLINLLYAIKNVPLEISWQKIIYYQSENLKNGINKVGIPDLIILQNVVDNDLELFSLDKHFVLMQKNIKFLLFEY